MEAERKPGEMLAGYRLEALLGRGGMGEVWRVVREPAAGGASSKSPSAASPSATSPSATSPGPYALKLPLDPALARVLRHEDALLRRLDHPAIVKEVELVREHDPPFLVMELAPGENARTLLRSMGALPLEVALAIFVRVLEGVAHAHERGIVHRDLKPENVIVEPRLLTVKITDFGLGVATEAALPALLSRSVLTSGTEGAAGTLEYMAPEQRRGKASADPRMDVYALGVFVYELLTGELPLGAFRLPTEVDPSWPTTLDRVVERALSPKAAGRFADAEALRRFLVAGLEREGFALGRLEPRAHAPAPPAPAAPTPPTPSAHGSSHAIPIARRRAPPAPPPRPASPTSEGTPSPPPPPPPRPTPASTANEADALPDSLFQPPPTSVPDSDLTSFPFRSCLPGVEPQLKVRARIATDIAFSPTAPSVAIALERNQARGGETVCGVVRVGWPWGENLRSLRFRVRTLVQLRAPGPPRHEAGGERPRGLLVDEEAVLAGPPGAVSLGRRLSEAFHAFAQGETRSALPPGMTEVPFALELTARPLASFSGALVTVSHVVVARLDIALGIDHDASESLTIEPPGELTELRSTAQSGERRVWVSLAEVEAERVVVGFGYDEPEGARPVSRAYVALFRDETILDGGAALGERRTIVWRGVVTSSAPRVPNRVAIPGRPEQVVASFDAPLPEKPGGVARVRTQVEVRLADAQGTQVGGALVELGWR